MADKMEEFQKIMQNISEIPSLIRDNTEQMAKIETELNRNKNCC